MARTNFNSFDDAALVAELSSKQVALTRAQFAHAANKLENTSSLGRMRTEIARLKTEIRRREIAAGLPKDSLEAKHRVTTIAPAAAAQASSGFLGGLVDKLEG